MAQTLPKMVTAKSGKQYDSSSPQGQMIVNAAKPAFDSDSKILASIATNVISIGEGVSAMVMIAQADARGDALNKSNVVQDDLGGAPAELTSGQMRDRGEGGGDDGGLGGLMGIGAMVGGFGKGLSFWGTPLAMAGAATFVLFLGGLIGIAYAGARTFNASSGEIAEGMETLSDADVDTDKVIAMGEALAKFGLAMGAQGLGAGIGGLGTLVGGIADGLAGFLGIEGKDPMVALKEFSKHDITEDELKQIEINARALTVFSAAMTVDSAGGVVQSFAGLISGVVDFASSFFPEGKDPMIELRKFSAHKIDDEEVAQIQRNALALVAFSTTMATTETIGVVEDIAKLASGVVNFASSFFPEGKDPMIEMRKFASHKFTQAEVDQIKLNAGALLAFSGTMGVAKTMGAVGDITGLFGGIANGISSLFGLEKKDPMIDMKKFAETKITQEEADQIGLNATALVNFSKAMAFYKASGAAADSLQLLGNMATGISNFFGGKTSIDYAEIKTFAESGIGELEPKITANALALSTFAVAMKDMAGDSMGVEFKNIGTNLLAGIGNFFGGDANANMQKNITAIEKFTETQLDNAKIDNNISAIEKFISFGQSMVGFKGGDLSGISDFAEAMVSSAHGIKYALHGGDDKYGVPGMFNDIKIKSGEGLSSVGIMEMTDASLGVAVLRHSLTNNAPLQELRAVSAEMNASTGGMTIIAPSDNSIKTNTSTTHLIDLEAAARQSAIDAFMLQQSAQ